MTSGKIAAKDRVAHGLCPACGKEAAPYRFCFDCRQMQRLTRSLKRGVQHGVLQFMGGATRLTKNTLIWKGAKFDDEAAKKELRKWSTPVVLPESDGRSKPRLRGITVDVEATLLKVMGFIGRPCTIDEIISAWGKLRDRRSAPLAHDLGRIIVADERRKAKNARRAAAFEKSQRRNTEQERSMTAQTDH